MDASSRKAQAGEHSPFFGFEAVQSAAEAPFNAYAGLCRQVLAATSRCLETQAEFARKLSECKTPTEALACQTEFTQKLVALGLEESSTAFGALQSLSRTGAKHREQSR